MRRLPWSIAIGITLVWACAPEPGPSGADAEVASWPGYADLLLHSGVPSGPEDWSVLPFADAGGWHGFSLPPERRHDLRGGFVGPFLMASGRWIGPQLAVLSLRDPGSGDPIDLAGSEHFEAYGLPGLLRQETVVVDLRVTLELWFETDRIALVRASLYNGGDSPRLLEASWSGSIFAEGGRLVRTAAGVEAHTPRGGNVRIETDRASSPPSLEAERFTIKLGDPIELEPNGRAEIALALTWELPEEAEEPVDPKQIASALSDPGGSFDRNRARWSRYLASIDTGRSPGDPVQILAVKSLQTLINNWRGPAGRLRHSGLFPSSNIGYFNGFWAWDSWKHAVGVARFGPELAKEQIRAMFDHQDERGMIADVVYLDPSEDNWRDTKPPLAGWAIRTVYEATEDLEFVRELYPKLVAYHEFWYADRDHDRDGLCEYGSTDGTLVAARWESGMDNAVRFDGTQMLQNGPAAWSMNQESVDLNSYLYFEKDALAHLAAALGRSEEAAQWSAEAAELGDRIRATMFDPESGWYYDTHIDTGGPVRVQGPEGWTPLWTGVASNEQAARIRTTMLDPAKFRTVVPFPTVARDDLGFSDGYWRGLVWLDQAHFAIEGLRRYGYHDDADQLTRQLFANLAGATARGEPLFENYHPLSGEGRNVQHFSWTAAHLLQLALDLPYAAEQP